MTSNSTQVSKHKHHIIPRYEGGSDFAENLVELTVTQHAMWHYAEWQRKGDWRDKLAWQGLAGLISTEEATKQAQSLGSLGRKKSEEQRHRQSKTMKEKIKREGPNKTARNFGVTAKKQWENYTEEERAIRCKKMSDAAKRRWAKARELRGKI